LLIAFVLLQSSFTNSDNLYYRLSEMYKTNKDKCLEFAEYKIRNNSKNYAPYFFALKIELERYQELPYIRFSSIHPDNKSKYDKHMQSMLKMIDYTNYIYDLTTEKQMYAIGCFLLFSDMNDELSDLIISLHKDKTLSLKKELLTKSDSFFSMEITDDSEDGSIITYTEFKDPRIANATPNTEVSKFLNGIPSGNETISSSDEVKELEFLKILNKARKEKGLGPLKLDYDLCRAARYHSYDMASQNYVGHATKDRPENRGKLIEVCTTFERIRKFASCGGEIIAAGSSTAEGAYSGWYNSPGHYKIMFNRSFTKVGIGYISLDGSKRGSYWTADFR